MARRTSDEVIETVKKRRAVKVEIESTMIRMKGAKQPRTRPDLNYCFLWMKLKLSPNRTPKHLPDCGWWWDGSRIGHGNSRLEEEEETEIKEFSKSIRRKQQKRQ
ncbi:hypothetical protein ISN44_As06g038740 [Arabidopsis suecica]|uniref:Uncharacterized protein n=1 Tax=Arabidopsis suecica TaxID=45249 RepID=A0A8T2CNG1_ARASU|nr:hypothetical protein ISN44_As06g038740 [Arabidopsis suecica]